MLIDKSSIVKLLVSAVLLFVITPFLLFGGGNQKQVQAPTIKTNSVYEESLADDAKLFIKEKLSSYIVSKAYLQQREYEVSDFTNLGGGFGFKLTPKSSGVSVYVYVEPSGFNDIALYADGNALN